MMLAAERDTTPSPPPVHADDDPPAYYRLEVQAAEWGGTSVAGWRPAVAGPLNQTRDDDETASTFATIHEAMVFLDQHVMPERPRCVRLVRTDGTVVFSADFGAA